MGTALGQLEKGIKSAFWKCLAFFIGDANRESPKRPFDFKSIHSILVIRHDRLGDVILSTPVYESLKRSFPWVKISVVVSRANAGILENNPHIDEIIYYEKERPLKLWLNLRGKKFDLALSLHLVFSTTSSMIAWLSGAKLRVGYKNPPGSLVYNVSVPRPSETRHEAQHNLDLLRYLETTMICDTPRIFFTGEETAKVERLLIERRQYLYRPLVLIKPGTRVAEWGWRLEKFRKVCDRLMESKKVEVLIIQGPGEEQIMKTLFTGSRHKPALLPLLSHRELALVIQQSNLLVCNHTGIMHMASAVGTPLLVIFKHGEVKRWGPCNTPHVVLEEREGETLSVDKVLEGINKLMDANPSK